MVELDKCCEQSAGGLLPLARVGLMPIDLTFKSQAAIGLATMLSNITGKTVLAEYWHYQDQCELDFSNLGGIPRSDVDANYWKVPAFLWNAYLLALEADHEDTSCHRDILIRATQHHFARQVLALYNERGTIKP